MNKKSIKLSIILPVLWNILGLTVLFGIYTPNRIVIALLYFLLALYSWEYVR